MIHDIFFGVVLFVCGLPLLIMCLYILLTFIEGLKKGTDESRFILVFGGMALLMFGFIKAIQELST